MYTGLKQPESEWIMKEFSFLGIYPFNADMYESHQGNPK